MPHLPFSYSTVLRVALFVGLLTTPFPSSLLASDLREDDKLKLVWADEFDVEGPPNPKVWSFEHGFVRNEELQWYQEENAFCRDGMLVIEAREQRVRNPGYQKGSKNWRHNRPSANYTSSCIHTRGKRNWKYGRFVMRAKIDVRPGLWPAFWTLGSARPWPGCGEIDVMEYYDGKLLANACWLGKHRKVQWDAQSLPLSDMEENWAESFHTWQLDWSAEQITISLDGKELNEISPTAAVNADRQRSEPFQEPHFILLNVAIGGSKGGSPAETSFPAAMLVDYVRVYER